MAKSPDKSKVKGKKKGRPKFCPNSSKNTALNRSVSNSTTIEVEEELKKNNAELAKNLNLHKEALAREVREKQELERERQTKILKTNKFYPDIPGGGHQRQGEMKNTRMGEYASVIHLYSRLQHELRL